MAAGVMAPRRAENSDRLVAVLDHEEGRGIPGISFAIRRAGSRAAKNETHP